MCIKPALLLFAVFAFIQIQLRWKRDVENIPKWSITLKGNSSSSQEGQTSKIVFYEKSTSGKPPITISKDKLVFHDNYEVFGFFHAKIEGAPLSYHKLVIKSASLRSLKPIRESIIACNMRGQGDTDIYKRFVTHPNDQIDFTHQYDSNYNYEGSAKMTLELFLCSGDPDAWDTPFIAL